MDDGNYWMRGGGRLPRRSLLRGAGVTSIGLAAAALIGCSGKSKSAATSTPAAGGAGTAAAGTGGAAAGTYTQPTSGWDKLTPEQFRTAYDGDSFKNLATQKNGPKYGFRARYPGASPADWSPLQPSGIGIPGLAWAHNQLIQVRTDDFAETTHVPQSWPVLAEAFPEQPDPLTYTFKLVKGVKFQNVAPVNGREMTSEDVKYTFEAYRKSPVQSPVMAPVASIDAIDPYTVRFKLSEPSAPFIAGMSSPTFWIFSKEQHTSAEGMSKRPIGTGARIFKNADPAAGYSFDKNPDYFRKDPRTGMKLPYLDGVDVITYQSGATQIAAFRAGDLDYVGGTVLNARSFTDMMKSNPTSVGQFTEGPAISQQAFVLRLDKAPYNDVRVRRALSMLIDRDAIVQNVLFGNGLYAYGQDWSFWGYKWGWPVARLGQYYKYNPTEAKKLLAAAGLDKGFTIPMFFGSQTSGVRFDLFSAATAMWEAAGIKTPITTTADAAGMVKVIFADKSVEGAFAWSDYPPGIDPDQYTYQSLKTGESNNIYYLSDPKIDKWCIDQRHALNKEDRKKILDDLMTYDLDQVTRVGLVSPDKINLRGANVFNLTDTLNCWSIFGWGPMASDVIWKSSDRPV